jgi:hypothetical protein
MAGFTALFDSSHAKAQNSKKQVSSKAVPLRLTEKPLYITALQATATYYSAISHTE